MNKLRLVRHFAAALSATAVASTQAAVIHWSDANLVIPATYEGDQAERSGKIHGNSNA